MAQAHLHTTNMIGMPTALFASAAFNLTPLPCHIQGVREAHPELFAALAAADRETAPECFHRYMAHTFGLPGGKAEHKAFSYLRLLKGWFFDSNHMEGAIMKGWVEVRFGLVPLYHREPIQDVNSAAYGAYLGERSDPRLAGGSLEILYRQLDLLYEYAQEWLERFGPRPRYLVLYRGANKVGPEHRVEEERERDLWVVRNNSLVSYAADRERADEFGDMVLRVEAPFPKVLCFPELLPGKLPHYESEHLLVGGDYLTEILPD